MCVCAGTARSICILAVFAKSSITATSAHIRLSFSIHGLSVNENQKKEELSNSLATTHNTGITGAAVIPVISSELYTLSGCHAMDHV